MLYFKYALILVNVLMAFTMYKLDLGIALVSMVAAGFLTISILVTPEDE
jgi:hypothetical protein